MISLFAQLTMTAALTGSLGSSDPAIRDRELFGVR